MYDRLESQVSIFSLELRERERGARGSCACRGAGERGRAREERGGGESGERKGVPMSYQ